MPVIRDSMPESCLSSLKALLVFSMRSMAKDSCHAVTLLGLSGLVRPCMVSLNAYGSCSRPLRTCLQNDALFIHCRRDTETKTHKARSWIKQQAMLRLYAYPLVSNNSDLTTWQCNGLNNWNCWSSYPNNQDALREYKHFSKPQNCKEAIMLSFIGWAGLNSAFCSIAIFIRLEYRCF